MITRHQEVRRKKDPQRSASYDSPGRFKGPINRSVLLVFKDAIYNTAKNQIASQMCRQFFPRADGGPFTFLILGC